MTSIEVGDYLASGSKPGYAMKATQSSRVLGVALEPLKGEETEGQVLCFVNPHTWVAPEGRMGI